MPPTMFATKKVLAVGCLIWSCTNTCRLLYAQNLDPNPGNPSFDPDAGEINLCNISPYQDKESYFQPREEMCGIPAVGLTVEDAESLAEAYAPVLFFHPLESYTMESVDATFRDPSKGKIYSNNKELLVFDEQLNMTSLLRTSRDLLLGLNSQNYFFLHELDEQYISGAGFDANGLSRAPIYYNVFDSGNNTWTFNYFFYYTFNGHSNMGVLSSWNGTETYTRFQLRPYGIHEGDWESMSVIVCQSADQSQPLAVSYRQHSYTQITDCTTGECTFYKDTFHPVGFSAVNSHATYPVSTQSLIYAIVQVPFFVNLQGVLIVDRTNYLDENGNYRYYMPNSTNVIRHQDMEEIELGVTDTSLYWQAFAGNWGNSTKPRLAPTPPDCLNPNQTEFIECPTKEEDPIFHLVMQFLDVYEPETSLVKAVTSVTDQVVATFSETGSGPKGPATKNYFKSWVGPKNAPLWNIIASGTTEDEFCRRLVEIPDTYRKEPDVDQFDLEGNVFGIIAFCCVLTFLNIFFFILPTVRNIRDKPLLVYDENGVVQQPGWSTIVRTHVPAYVYLGAYIMILIGGILFFSGFGSLFSLLSDQVSGVDWDFLRRVMLSLSIIVLVIDTALLVFIWIPTRELWLRVQIKYFDMVGDEDKKEKYDNYIWWNVRLMHALFKFFFGILFLSLMLACVCVIAGVGVVGFSYVFVEVCDNTVGSLDGVCLDLDFLGVDEIQCGSDFQEFCQDWSKSARATTLWGSIILLAGHFYLIGAAGSAALQHRIAVPALNTYPSHEKYQQSIAHLKKYDAASPYDAAEKSNTAQNEEMKESRRNVLPDRESH